MSDNGLVEFGLYIDVRNGRYGRNGVTSKSSFNSLLVSLRGESCRYEADVYNWNASAAFNEFSLYARPVREVEFIGWGGGVDCATPAAQLRYSIVIEGWRGNLE